jgi:hypothetical protein
VESEHVSRHVCTSEMSHLETARLVYSRQLADQELSRLLVTTNLTKSDSSGTVTVRLLDTTSGGRRLASSLGSELLAGSLSSGRLAGGLLGTGHC